MSNRKEAIKAPDRLGQISSKMAVVFLIIMAGSYILNAMDRQVFPVLLSRVMNTYGFNLQEAGLLSTVFTVGLGLAGIPTGYLLDRSSRKTVMVVGTIIYSGFTLFTILAIGFYDLLFYRAMTGIGEGMQNAALFAAAGSYFYRQRTLVLGVLNVAFGLGGFLGPYLGTKLTLLSGNWHTPFIVYGVAGIAVALVVWIVLPKAFTDSKGPQKENGFRADEAAVASVPDRLWNRNVILCAVTGIVIGFSMFGYIGLYPTFLTQQLKYPPMEAALGLSIYGIGCMMAIPIGYIGDRFSQRRLLIFANVGTMIVSYFMFNVFIESWQQNVLSFFQGIFISACLFVNCYALIQRCVRPEMVGRASGIHVTSVFLPSSTSGYIFASLVGYYGWGGAASILLSVCPLIGIAALMLMKDEQIMAVDPRKV